MVYNSLLLDLAVITIAAEIGGILFNKLRLSPIS